MNRRSSPVLGRHRLIIGFGLRAARLAESVATVLVLIIFSGGVLRLVLHGGQNWPDGFPPTTLERVSFWFAYAFIALQVAIRPRALMRAAMNNVFVPCVVLIAALSVVWSIDPGASLREAFRLVMWTLFGLYLGCRLTTRAFLHHLGVALGILALVSLAFGIFAPGLGLEQESHVRAWRGAFTTKNVFGEMMLMASVVFTILVWQGAGPKLIGGIAVIAAVGLVVLSQARGALIVGATLVTTVPLIVGLSHRGSWRALALCGILALGTLAVITFVEQEPLLHAIGKDATLTGRTAIWGGVWEHIQQRPILGYGYQAFWVGTDGPAERLRAMIGWETPHSHNGFMDLWLSVGVVGLMSFVAGSVVAVQHAWARLSSARLDSVWRLTVLAMLIIGNVTESTIYSNPLMWTIFVAVASGGITGRGGAIAPVERVRAKREPHLYQLRLSVQSPRATTGTAVQ